MEFDEYEYLEKSVEDPEEGNNSSRMKHNGAEKSERSYRKIDGDRQEEEDERKSKRSRDDGRDRGRHRSGGERESERERRSREKDKERELGRERDRDRERNSTEMEKERARRDREKEERERGRRERDKEKEERERERSERERVREEREVSRRSRSHSRRRESDQDRERVGEIEEPESRRSKEKKEVELEADPERDQRTVFAYQMSLKANERDVYDFFTNAGKVRDVRLIMDRNSRRSKGVGYIEFYDAMSVPMAIALSGHLLLGQPVMVKPSEAEKNLVQSTASGGGSSGLAGPYGTVDRKLYVGNLHFNMAELQLRKIFEPFGPVELVQLPLDLETGQCKGFGFVQFAQLEHAKAAQSLNGKLEIAGRTIKVSSVTDHVGAQDTGAKYSYFNDDDGGGLSLNAQSRAMLMQKLDRSGIATSIAGSLGAPMLNGAAPNQQAISFPLNGQATISASALPMEVVPSASKPVGNPSECLLLKNLFDPATETEPDFDEDIKEDVQVECSKVGRVKHIHVDKNSAGCVYLRFETVEGAIHAQRAMHMRWFAGRLISALFMQPHQYDVKVKET